MPESKTLKLVARDKREGKNGARSAKQAIAIGLSKARRVGIELPAPRKKNMSQIFIGTVLAAQLGGCIFVDHDHDHWHHDHQDVVYVH